MENRDSTSLTSSALARAAGVSADTLRHYEQLGILGKPPRAGNGYRLYPPQALDRVRLIRNALAFGFTLSELTAILRQRDAGAAPCREVAHLESDKVIELDTQIQELTELRDSLKQTVSKWKRQLEKTPDGKRAGLLESLPQRIENSTSMSKRKRQMKALMVLCALALSAAAYGQSECPMHAQHMQDSAAHAAAVDARGDQAMGFSHEKTAHHFQLLPDGGSIEVIASDPGDAASRDQIKAHLSHIVQMFSDGNFELPMFIHDTVPPGVPVMRSKRSAIAYAFERTTTGGRVRITTTDPDALTAVHQFLAFQIDDHRTHDAKAPQP